ncbi:Ubiquitin fusion degradation protein 1-like protein [Dichanthelium oligosanthes]|uniref:Ubiquitin fusion degradation protein 1-like protein n=1 Tax=Dichanthelium oligosanthes TaxID=888268 RepID=A0A1E5VMH9_9POAL|nr:Ubiquitin fusion degradation protein 1-like protein [Dichanthelium oligosanthes]
MFFSFGGRRFPYHHASRFEQIYRCYPASSSAKPHLEDGDKVILPASTLHRLAYFHIDYPMLFELRRNDGAASAAAAEPRTSHCGVLEFVADEGTVVMPDWMMQNMRLRAGDTVRMRSAALPKGTYVKLQPHTSDFLDVSNPKAVLEKTLRSFSCFTTGDTVMVSYNDRRYYINIVETKPASAVSIIDTDCEVDFAPPLDYKEPEKPQQPAAVVVPASNKAPAERGDDDDTTVVKDEPKFKPFTGSGKRLDGKASKLQAPEAPSTTAGSAPSESNGRTQHQQMSAPATSGASSSTRQKTGKLMFGSSASTSKLSSNKEAQRAPVKQEEPPKKDEPKFQAFTGKGYSLKH